MSKAILTGKGRLEEDGCNDFRDGFFYISFEYEEGPSITVDVSVSNLNEFICEYLLARDDESFEDFLKLFFLKDGVRRKCIRDENKRLREEVCRLGEEKK